LLIFVLVWLSGNQRIIVCVETRSETGRMKKKANRKKLLFPLAPISGHNSTRIHLRFHGSRQWTGERRKNFTFSANFTDKSGVVACCWSNRNWTE